MTLIARASETHRGNDALLPRAWTGEKGRYAENATWASCKKCKVSFGHREKQEMTIIARESETHRDNGARARRCAPLHTKAGEFQTFRGQVRKEGRKERRNEGSDRIVSVVVQLTFLSLSHPILPHLAPLSFPARVRSLSRGQVLAARRGPRMRRVRSRLVQRAELDQVHKVPKRGR